MNVQFQYHAAAAAASGTITVPFKEQIPVIAASSLPPGGGYGAGRASNVRHHEILSIQEAWTYVTGSETKDSFETAATSVVIGLNILDMVTADRVVARFTSRRLADGSEASIIPLGSRFENLRIAGKPVPCCDRLETDLFTEFDTFGKITGDDKSLEGKRKDMDNYLETIAPPFPEGLEPGLGERLRPYLPYSGLNRAGLMERVKKNGLTASLMPSLKMPASTASDG